MHGNEWYWNITDKENKTFQLLLLQPYVLCLDETQVWPDELLCSKHLWKICSGAHGHHLFIFLSLSHKPIILYAWSSLYWKPHIFLLRQGRTSKPNFMNLQSIFSFFSKCSCLDVDLTLSLNSSELAGVIGSRGATKVFLGDESNAQLFDAKISFRQPKKNTPCF